MIDNASIESLKSSVDIVDVIGSFIELRKAGANYKANCPFHGEKTPSFVVSPSKQIYHCFGCGVGGDSIKFVMELEKLSYPEAIEKLASMNNFSLTYTKGSSDYSDAKRVLEAIGQWYVKKLDQNPTATKYLLDRGVSHSSIEKFEIGYVPEGREVMQFLQSTLLPVPQAIEAGVLAQSENGQGTYARLVERITFPIYSASGAVVGFGGRTISNHPAKYINSPQTKLFNKSRLLYGYNLAKESIYKNKRLIVCEGYLDVVMFHQAGFTEAVAGMGTALTSEHLPLLRKGDPKIILAYDGDKAGVDAALKAAQMLSVAGFDGGVVLFPNGQDPADLIATGQSEKVATLLRDSKPLIPFVVEKIVEGYNLHDPRAKEAGFGQVKQFLDSMSQIIKDAYIPLASTLLGVAPALFGGNVNLANTKQSFTQSKDDTEMLGIIKTMIEDPSLIDTVINSVNIDIFGAYAEHFTLLLNGENEHPLLMGISVNDQVHTLEKTELLFALRKMLIRYYKVKLRTLPREQNLSSEKKMFLIRKLRTDIIPRLEKGELVTYDLDI
ncbi:MAG: DNA primase (EC [uncultured Sulfurovum sp.]|uniref:DNA primase n=1 Tax=uncultured Sulfurovum sp. TaxID=269237 RepID=A0A6S6THC7_9BACT|nr:MAG: DNA primase (EC [uncultured Sulfurovum sp.]